MMCTLQSLDCRIGIGIEILGNLMVCEIRIESKATDSVRKNRCFGLYVLWANRKSSNIPRTYTIYDCSIWHTLRDNQFDQMALVTYWERTSRTESQSNLYRTPLNQDWLKCWNCLQVVLNRHHPTPVHLYFNGWFLTIQLLWSSCNAWALVTCEAGVGSWGQAVIGLLLM